MKKSIAVLAAVILLTGCSLQSESSDLSNLDSEVVSSSMTSTSSSSRVDPQTSFSVVDISPVYSTSSSSSTFIWAGNDGILDPVTEYDFPYVLEDDLCDSLVKVDSVSKLETFRMSASRHTLAESVLVADAPSYKLVFNGLVDNKLSFSFTNRLNEPCVFNLKCLSINNLHLSRQPDPYNMQISDCDKINVAAKESVDLSFSLIRPNSFDSVDLKEMVFEFSIDDDIFYGRILTEKDVLTGHVYNNKYRAFKPINYRWCYSGDKIFVKDDIYGYKAAINFDDQSFTLRVGMLNNSLYNRVIKARISKINGNDVSDRSFITVSMEPCDFITADIPVKLDSDIESINSIEMELTVDVYDSVINMKFDRSIFRR